MIIHTDEAILDFIALRSSEVDDANINHVIDYFIISRFLVGGWVVFLLTYVKYFKLRKCARPTSVQ